MREVGLEHGFDHTGEAVVANVIDTVLIVVLHRCIVVNFAFTLALALGFTFNWALASTFTFALALVDLDLELVLITEAISIAVLVVRDVGDVEFIALELDNVAALVEGDGLAAVMLAFACDTGTVHAARIGQDTAHGGGNRDVGGGQTGLGSHLWGRWGREGLIVRGLDWATEGTLGYGLLLGENLEGAGLSTLEAQPLRVLCLSVH